jgi:hypothetical protein
MSDHENQGSTEGTQSQQNQSTPQSPEPKVKKRSAPEYPPATPLEQRSNSMNMNKDKDVMTF